MRRKNTRLSTKLKIAGATASAIFSLASVFSATYAWFASQNSVQATGMTIRVKNEEHLQYKLYYLQSFANSQHGNYNPTINSNSGYEVDYSSATFGEVTYDANSQSNNGSSSQSNSQSSSEVNNQYNPTDISNLWPAHRLTFAVVITSQTMTKFSISSWSENEGHELANAAKVSANQYVRLSWAINVYGYAYSVQNPQDGNDATAVEYGYSQYYYNYLTGNNKRDRFPYSQESLAPVSPNTKPELIIVGDQYAEVPADADGYKTIVYFTIEFSNDSSTYYRQKQDGYYEKSTAGSSSCYERLQLDSLAFTIA